MPEISIVADIMTGKLIQKYLNRTSVIVESLPADASQAGEPVSLTIVDVSGLSGTITSVLSRMNASTGCTRYILITSMENPLLNEELASISERWSVATIAKPIKLSELKRIVDGLNFDIQAERELS